MTYLAYFALTVVCEAVIALLATRDWRLVAALVCANAISHPVAYFAVGEGANFYLIEAIVIVAEVALLTLGLSTRRLRNAIVVIAANVVTALIGTLL